MSARVLILGASRYYARSIRSVSQAGFFTIAADREPQSPGFKEANESYICDIVDLDGIEAIARAEEIDVIIPLNDYGVLTAAVVSERLGLPGISVAAATASTNKEVMRTAWSEQGLPSPRFEVHLSRDDLKNAVERVGFPCILKPAHGIGGASRGVSVVSDASGVPAAVEMALGAYPGSGVVVEEFMPGTSEHSCEILLFQGRSQIVAVGDKVKSDLPYRVDRSVIYPTKLTPDEVQMLEELVQKATAALGLEVGVAHLEFSMSPSGPVLFEIGARCGGGSTPEPIVSSLTGVHMVVEHIKALLGQTIFPIAVNITGACVYQFLFGREGVVREVIGWPPLPKRGEIIDAELFVKRGSRTKDVVNGTDRVGFLVVSDQDRSTALSVARHLEMQIEIRYYE